MTFLSRRAVLRASLLSGAAGLLGACKATGAADPGTLVVLAHPASGEVRFLQFGSGKVIGRVAVGGEPFGMVRDPERGRVYVTDRAGDSVAAINVLDQSVIKQTRVGREPRFATLSPDGRRLFVSVAGEGVLATVDTETLETVGRVQVGGRPAGVAVAPDGRVFVASDGDGTIAFVDAGGQRRIARSMQVAGGVRCGLAISSDGATLLAGAAAKPSLLAIATGSRDLREIPLGVGAAGGTAESILATPDGRFWTVALRDSSELVAMPAGGGEPVRVALDAPPTGLAVAPGGRLLATSVDAATLYEIELDKGRITRRLRIGDGHAGLVVFSKSALDELRERS